MSLEDDILKCRRHAEIYREAGYNPLPSRMTDKKNPLCGYRDYWERPFPAEKFNRYATTNIQVMTGRFWKLLVIDLDGQEGKDWFFSKGRPPRTWTVESGSGGMHLWFELPYSLINRPLPSAFLWKGEGKHQGVERLCDKKLTIAPPSLHVETKKRYRWLSEALSPKTMRHPAICPRWILDLPPLVAERKPSTFIKPANVAQASVRRPGRFVPSEDVLDAIHDKARLAKRWGLRLASDRANSAGWIPCHAIDREDRNPSASFNEDSGWYSEPAANVKIGLFDLAVELGRYSTWKDAADDLAVAYGVERREL